MTQVEWIQMGRAMGKTTAMLERIADLQDRYKLIVIITMNHSEARRIVDLIVTDYWELEIDPSRVIVQPVGTLDGFRGDAVSPIDIAACVDNWDLFSPQQKDTVRRGPFAIKVVTETP